MRRSARSVLRTDPVMAGLIEAAGPLRLKRRGTHPPFESLARAIAHQQLHGAAAARILERFCGLFAPLPFPKPRQVLDAPPDLLRSVGFSLAKVTALRDLAARSLDGTVPDAATLATLTDAQIVERLTSVRGIGCWTVQMLLIFDMGRPDVMPADDFGVRNGFRLAYRLSALPTVRALAQFAERWRPFRSAAAWYLWRAVDLSREQRLPRCARPPRLELQRPAARSRPVKARR